MSSSAGDVARTRVVPRSDGRQAAVWRTGPHASNPRQVHGSCPPTRMDRSTKSRCDTRARRPLPGGRVAWECRRLALVPSRSNTERVNSTPNPTVKPRADLVEAALPFLPAGSDIRQAFMGQAAPSFYSVVITDEVAGDGETDARAGP